jgi:arginyl-tRNA synthetase
VPPEAIRRLESELERLAGAQVKLDRPSRAEHGDYATNVALQQGPRDGRPPRDVAASLAREAAGLPEV